jgi:hypothetical protein
MPRIHYLNLSLAIFVSVSMGCSSDKGSDSTTPLAVNTRVQLIAEEGEFALIETADAQQYYVDRGLLKTRSNMAVAKDPSHTHTLSAPAQAFHGSPPESMPETAPRPLEDISKEQLALNRLYMTEKTHRHILAPSNTRPFVDEVTGENVWPACTCHNPDCPKKGTDKEPYLFVLFDRSKPPICPACVEAFQLVNVGQEELIPYLRWTRTYELEEKKRRVKQLDAERKRAYRALKQKLPRN